MALDQSEQIAEVIKKSNHILIAFPKDFSIDAAASALALYLILKKQDKLVDIACDGFELPKNLKFLPKTDKISGKLSNLQKFVISLDIKNDKIENFSYSMEDNKLKIYITPKSGRFSKDQVETENSEYKYDLIITLDAPDLESLGEIYQKSTEFFFNTTILNIDHKPENEDFGQINLINVNTVATSEMLYRLINTLDKNLLDAEIATCLLTGLITKTRSFKKGNVTPATLEIAGRLLEAGAEQESIIKSLYRSRTLNTLNLWGRVLARLKSQGGNKLVWSILTDNDFVEAGAAENDLDDVIDELISFIPGVEIAALIYQINGKNKVIIKTLKNYNALYLAGQFKPEGSKETARFEIPDKTLLEAEQEVINQIEERLEGKDKII